MGDGLKERDPSLDPARATFEKSIVARMRDPRGRRARAGDADDEAARERDLGAPHRRDRRPHDRPASSSRTTSSRRPILSKRKVCVVVACRANYARIKTALEAIRDHPDLELQLVAGASLVLERFGNALDVVTQDGFEPDATIRFIIEGETPATMAKSTGLGLLELPTVFERLQPDVVVTVADRFETIATAVAAAYMNIPVAHTQGGEVSGSIDESVRHAVTKLAHIHFPATELAARRVIAMGEDPACGLQRRLSVDRPRRADRPRAAAATSLERDRRHRRAVRPRAAVRARDAAPGHDRVRARLRPDQRDARGGRRARHAGARLLAERRRRLRGRRQGHPRRSASSARRTGFHFFRNLPPEDFVRLMAHCVVHGRQLVVGAARGLVPRHAGGHRRHAPAGPRARAEPRRGRPRPPRSPMRSATRSRTAPTSASQLFGDGTAGDEDRRHARRARPPVQKRLLLATETAPTSA